MIVEADKEQILTSYSIAKTEIARANTQPWFSRTQLSRGKQRNVHKVKLLKADRVKIEGTAY